MWFSAVDVSAAAAALADKFKLAKVKLQRSYSRKDGWPGRLVVRCTLDTLKIHTVKK